MSAHTRRDLTILPMGNNCLVIACDTCGAVGIKSGDILKISPRYAAKFTARVALTEVMCAGATPTVVINGVSCEMSPTGMETIKGINDEIENTGLSDIILTGSTEENFPTCMTAMAITVIGTAPVQGLKFDNAATGDRLVLFGSPKVGTEVDLDEKGFYPEIKMLQKLPGVKEIVPAGSKGIASEVSTLAALSKVTYKLYETGIDYNKSAGPATCLIVLCSKPTVKQILNFCPGAICIGEI
ncbi:MAG: alpha-ribazole-5-phosphate synthase [Firmicutes bacterium]|nr:alpha-ribazole-5-phosphate synthase [Bacillota bacterium]